VTTFDWLLPNKAFWLYLLYFHLSKDVFVRVFRLIKLLEEIMDGSRLLIDQTASNGWLACAIDSWRQVSSRERLGFVRIQSWEKSYYDGY
jgi:hypothetical protein